ncbi:unnamed protein product [Durusdinium trenchii]|uniref:Tubulin--tyrosine ligase-like protein 5 n=1 Tax=Durusdinium trenchii TaxID=1381693 RepID=A0ABP0Q2Y2_9DINO
MLAFAFAPLAPLDVNRVVWFGFASPRSVEPAISSKTKQLIGNRENCFELYGFDVLVDSDLKPWLLEVNLSPSMQAEPPLDWQIKSSLLADTFNLVGIGSNEKPTPKLERLRGSYSQPWKQANKETPKVDIPDIDDSHAPLVLNALSDANLKMLTKSIGERSRCHNFVVLFPTRAAVKRYGMITEARAQSAPRTGLTGLMAKLNRCVSQSQMLASILYGPYPSRSITEVKRLSSRETLDQLFLDDVDDWPTEEPIEQRNRVVADLDTILQASSPITWKDPRPAFFAKPLPAAVNPTVETELRQTALSSAWRALGALSGTSRRSSVVKAGEFAEEQTKQKQREHSDEQAEDSSSSASDCMQSTALSGSRLLLMEYLIRMEATCDSLGPAGRARLVQSASYARLSKFQRHLPKVAAKLASLSKYSLIPPEAISENGCLVEDMTAVCRESLDFLERLAWREAQGDHERVIGPRRASGDQSSLPKRLPASLLQHKHCRRLLKALPDLQVSDLEKLLRAHLTEEFGDDATLQRMLECFRDPEVCEEQLCTDFRRSASIQPGVIKEPTFSLQKSRSSMLPVIQGECGARTMCTSEGRRKPPGPLSEILSAAITKRDQLPSQRSGRRPQTNSRQARTPVNLRGIYNSTLASWKASSRPLAADKEPKVMASAVMMPVPRFVSVRRSRSKSYALPELPEVKAAAEGSRVGDHRDVAESPGARAACHAATNIKFDIEL